LLQNNSLNQILTPPAIFNDWSGGVNSSMAGFWESCLLRFEQELPEQQFNTWIKPLRLEGEQVALEEGLRLIAPNGFILKWVRDRYLSRIEEYSHSFFSARLLFRWSLVAPRRHRFVVIQPLKNRLNRQVSLFRAQKNRATKTAIMKSRGCFNHSPSITWLSAKPMIWPGLRQFRSPTTLAPPTTPCSSTAVPALARRT
jgi:hypothetical protein